jgi:hypothetical protein
VLELQVLILIVFLLLAGPGAGVRVPPLQVGDCGEDNMRRAFIIVGSIFLTSLIALVYVYTQFPELEP